MKKVLALLLALAMIFALGACSVGDAPAAETPAEDKGSAAPVAGDTNGDGNWKVGIANREITNDYNRLIAYGARDILEAAGCEVVMTDAEADIQRHSENVETLLNSGIDALIIQLGDNDQLAPLCAKAAEMGIPVVTAGISSHIDNTICDVNGDDAIMAVLLANAIFAGIDYEGDVYIFYVPGAPLLENRLAVITGVASMYSGINLIPVPTEHNVSKTQTQVEELLTANPDKGSIAAIIGTYDSMITGAVESVRQAGRTEIVMGGIDGDQVSFQMLFTEGSPFQVSVVMDATAIGATAANTILGVLKGELDPTSMPSKVATDCYVATRKNGVEAAEKKWTETVWDAIGMAKADVEAAFPQTDTVLVVRPTNP